MSRPHPMSSLHCPYQVDPFPHVDVAVQGTWIRDLVFRTGEAEDGLEVAGFPKNATFRCERVSTQAPKLWGESERV